MEKIIIHTEHLVSITIIDISVCCAFWEKLLFNSKHWSIVYHCTIFAKDWEWVMFKDTPLPHHPPPTKKINKINLLK